MGFFCDKLPTFFGQLGDGGTTDRSTPTHVAGSM
jgi:hypothetical protein